MKFNRYRLLGALFVAVAALAVPASVYGHGSVYTDIAVIDTNTAAGPYTLANQTRHVVTNHGFTMLLRETNGANDKGMVDYSRLPGDYRATLTLTQLLAEGDTAAQPHATCRGVAALESEVAITGWQEDPFYNYIPFQKVAAGLEDTPSLWIEDVKTLTTGISGGPVDLSLVSDDPAQATTDLTAACTDLGGTFTPPDQTQTSTANLNSGYAHLLTEPLDTQIGSLTASLTATQATVDAQAATIKKYETAVTVKLNGKISSSGATVDVTGPAGESVTVTATCKKSDKKTGLTAGALGKASGKLDANGKAQLKIKLGSRAKKALKKAKGSKVSFSAVLTDASASASGKI